MAENITNAVVPPIHPSAIMDIMQFGGTGPNYTWRKGGLATDPEDNHLWLITGGANDAIIPEQNALIEIDPDDKVIKFWGTTSLLDGLEFQDNTLGGSVIMNGSITADKLVDGIKINGSTLTLTNSRSINGVMFNGSSNVINYASCTTPASTAAKAVNVPGFKLITGATISVKFEDAVSVNNPTLNVTGSGAKPIFYHGAAITSNKLLAKTVYTLVYDGANWNVVGDLTATMTDNKTAQVLTSNDAQYPLVFAGNVDQAATSTTGVRFAPVFSANPGTGKITAPTIVSKTSGSIPSINNQSSGSVINIENNGNIAGISSHKLRDGTIALVSGLNNGITVNYTRKADVDANVTEPTFQATLMDDAGNATFPNQVTAQTFIGEINHATRADRDSKDRVIVDTYLTKEDGDAKYVKLTGDSTIKGTLRVPQIAGEANTAVSTVGWTQSEIEKAKRQLKDEIIGDTEGSYDTIKELMELVQSNSDILETLQNATNEFVSFNKKQTLNDVQKTTAANNIAVLPLKGGTVSGNLTVQQTFQANKPVKIGDGVTIVNNSVTVGTNPSSNVSKSIVVTDKSYQSNYTELVSTVDKSGNVTSELRAKANKVDGKYGALSVISYANGTIKATAPAPEAKSNDASIATTAWVNDVIDLAQQNAVDQQTYTNIKAAGTSVDQGMMYFAKIIPATPLDSSRVRFTFECTTPFTDYNCSGVCEVIICGQKYSYQYWVDRANDNIIAFEGINVKLAKIDTLTNDGGHFIAFSLAGSNNPNIAGYERSFDIVAVESDGCVFELLPKMTVGSSQGITSTTHNTDSIISVKQSGFYYTSTINYGDRLAHWDRVPTAGNEGLIRQTIVAADIGGSLYSLVKSDSTATNKVYTTVKIRPDSLMYYAGPTLASNQTGKAGTLYSVITFDGAHSFNVTSNLSANQRVYLQGVLDANTGLYTVQGLVDELPGTNDNKQYILLGYAAGTGTKNIVLSEKHPIFSYIGTAYTEVSLNPFITTPETSDNSNRTATTKYVKNNITNSWVNPSVNTSTNDTQLFIRAKKGSFVANTLPASGTDYSQSVVFMDGQNKTTMDSSIGYIEAYTESTGHSMMFAVTNPANPEGDADAYVTIEYAKSGSNWVPSIELSHSPATKDSSMKIATTKYVQDNLKSLEVIDGGVL